MDMIGFWYGHQLSVFPLNNMVDCIARKKGAHFYYLSDIYLQSPQNVFKIHNFFQPKILADELVAYICMFM